MSDYNINSHTLFGGINLIPSEKVTLDLTAWWNSSDAALDQLDLVAPADFLARNPRTSYDFTLTHTNSDLDTSRIDARADLTWFVTNALSIRGTYHYIDFTDDAPYIEDLSGSVHYFGGGVGYSF